MTFSTSPCGGCMSRTSPSLAAASSVSGRHPARRYPLADVLTHDDLLRPRTRVLLGQLVRRVDAELAAVELPPGGVVEVVERALGDQHVPLRVDVRRDAEEDVRVVVHVHVRVDDDDRLREREHPEAPQRVHDLLRVAGERLADRDDHAVVERAGDRQVVVDDLGQRHADGRAGRSARSPCRATRPRPAACRRRSRSRSRRAASSSPRCGRSGTARRASSSPCGRRTGPRCRRRPSRRGPRGRSRRSPAPRGRPSCSARARPARRAGTRRA